VDPANGVKYSAALILGGVNATVSEAVTAANHETNLTTAQREALLRPAPFDLLYGLELVECSDRLVRGRVPVTGRITQPLGLVHGGVYAAVAESLASTGTNRGVAEQGMVALGVSNHTSFLRPIGSGHVNGEAVRRHRGGATWLWDVNMTNDDGELCAISRMTIAVRRQHLGP
jgi:1,4-dihydroxy-2-naphthoyl-CoA hydrolase